MLSTQTASEPSTRAEPALDEAAWDSTLARCVATLLIANSHLEAFYPLSWLAADGLLGNTMFFMVSGLGLAMRNRTTELSFFGWYRRRVLRIYPSLWICVLALMIGVGGSWRTWAPLDYVHSLAWPTDYAFVMDIMVYYALAYVLLRRPGAPRWALLAAAVLAVGIALQIASTLPAGRLSIGTIPAPFWRVWWLLMFLLGMAIPRLGLSAFATGTIGWLLAGSFVLYVALKYAMVVRGTFPRAFLLLFAIGTLVAVCSIVTGAKSDWIRDGLATTPIGSAIRWIGGLSLEVYLFAPFVQGRQEIARLPFPLNVAVFLAATFMLAFVTARVAARIRRRLAPG